MSASPTARLGVLDLKSGWAGAGRTEPECYRMECFDCPHFTWSSIRGLKTPDGRSASKGFYCQKIDVEQQPCIIPDKTTAELTKLFLPAYGQAPQAQQPGPTSTLPSQPDAQPSSISEIISGKRELRGPPTQDQPAALPHLQPVASAKIRSRSKKRAESKADALDLPALPEN